MGKYRAAVIGLGKIGLMYDFDAKRERPSSHVLAYQLHPDIELVGGADCQITQADFLKKVAPNTAFYQDANSMLIECRADIVSICTPVDSHLRDVERVLLSPKPPRIIFCEKPLVLDLEQVNRLKEMLEGHKCILVPNLSRRWNNGMKRIKECIFGGKYGAVQKIHIRYTRGINNSGSHIFDLIRWWVAPMERVKVIEKVRTSADLENDSSFSFSFKLKGNISGVAEAFSDEQYYMMEIDLYFSHGKIEVRNSGDDVFYYRVGEHHLFSGFNTLHLEAHETKLLSDSNLMNAVEHLNKVLEGKAQPKCTLEDGAFPLQVAAALVRSYNNGYCAETVE